MDEVVHSHEHHARREIIPNLPLLNCFLTVVEYEEKAFEIIYCNDAIKVSLDEENYAVFTLKNQQVPYKATMLGGFALHIQKAGNIDYKKYFYVIWQDELSTPELTFFSKPSLIRRQYEKGQLIELGIEPVACYHVGYPDGVTAKFIRTGPGTWEFSFSTGFHGSFKKEDDGTHSIRFKGLPMEADEDEHRSESKFILSRSKYTNNLLLILQDNAEVLLEHA
jgi:hypothetical protein